MSLVIFSLFITTEVIQINKCLCTLYRVNFRMLNDGIEFRKRSLHPLYHKPALSAVGIWLLLLENTKDQEVTKFTLTEMFSTQISDSKSEWRFIRSTFFSVLRIQSWGKSEYTYKLPKLHRLTVQMEVCLDLTKIVVKINQHIYLLLFLPKFSLPSTS